MCLSFSQVADIATAKLDIHHFLKATSAKIATSYVPHAHGQLPSDELVEDVILPIFSVFSYGQIGSDGKAILMV